MSAWITTARTRHRIPQSQPQVQVIMTSPFTTQMHNFRTTLWWRDHRLEKRKQLQSLEFHPSMRFNLGPRSCQWLWGSQWRQNCSVGEKKCLDDDISQQERLSFVFHPTAQLNTRKPFSLPLLIPKKRKYNNFVSFSKCSFCILWKLSSPKQ